MSIIERVADMLGPVREPQRRTLSGADLHLLEADRIERAGSSVIHQPIFDPEVVPAQVFDTPVRIAPDSALKQKSFAAVGVGAAKTAAAREMPESASVKTSQSLHIDLDALRERSMITPDADRNAIGESFRRIKRQLLANVGTANAEHGTNLVMVTSPMPGEGKTFCTINLAISLAMEVDRTVLLVDADVARPSVLRELGVSAKQGLMDVLLDRSIDLADVLYRTNIGKLSILPAGTQQRHATELLASETMRGLLIEMSQRYSDRIIIFDSPPLLATSESAVLASQMGQILVVVAAEQTTETALRDALRRIEKCNVTGVLLNKARGAGGGSGGYEGYGYGYGYGGGY